MRHALFAIVVAATVAACGGAKDDPFTADLKMICAAGEGRDDLPPEMRNLEALRSIADKIKTAEAARLLSELMRAAPSERPAMIDPVLAKAGIKRCAFLGR